MSPTRTGRRQVPSRQAERYSTYRDLSLVYEGRSETMQLRAPDISSRGMFIHMARHFPEGAVVKVEFTLSRSLHQVHARAEVRYCLEGVGIGVEFVDISPADQQAIENEIRILMGD
jgi:c-di-GMP-binding flagellar brake protein YcgR